MFANNRMFWTLHLSVAGAINTCAAISNSSIQKTLEREA